MNNLCKLFSILQLTKEQPLTGYIPAGIKGREVPTLAEHHYTAAMMGWFLVQKIHEEGGHVSEKKVVIMLLIHDLTELFGGDIAGPLNRKYPDLRQYKDKIGERAMLMLSQFVDGPTGNVLEKYWLELQAGQTDEALIVKIIDQIDHQFFLEHHNHEGQYGIHMYRNTFMNNHILSLADEIQDHNTKATMKKFLEEFMANWFRKGYQAMKVLMNET